MQNLYCPHCGHQINASGIRNGQTVQCPYCGKSFINSLKDSLQSAAVKSTGDKHALPIAGIPRGSFFVAISIAAVGIVGSIAYYQSTRFEIINHENVVYRIDRHTGKMAVVNRFGKLTEVEEPKSVMKNPERKLTSAESAKVAGRAWLTNSGEFEFGKFEGDMYNGNADVVVTRFTVEIQYKNRNDDKDIVSRRYRCDNIVFPLKSSPFFCKVMEFDKEYEYTAWFISDIWGHDENKND